MTAAGPAPGEPKVRFPTFRDVMRHLVHHAADLSPEMRDQYRDAIDSTFPPEPEPARGPEPEPGPDLPPPPG